MTFLFSFDENVTVAARIESAIRIRALLSRGKEQRCREARCACFGRDPIESISLPSAPHRVFLTRSRRPRSLTSAVLDTGRTCKSAAVCAWRRFPSDCRTETCSDTGDGELCPNFLRRGASRLAGCNKRDRTRDGGSDEGLEPERAGKLRERVQRWSRHVRTRLNG